MARDILGFSTLDDLVLAADKGISVDTIVHNCTEGNIGPLVEYEFQRTPHELPELVSHPLTSALRRAISNRMHSQLLSLKPRAVEFSRLPATRDDIATDTKWSALLMRLQQAGETAGFSKLVSAGFAGTAMELTENIFIHSNHPSTGIIGYRQAGATLEFVIADAGDGVLRSLRQDPSHSNLSDSGTALKLALEGHSRFGKGHGNGFRQLFVSLASLHGEVRCRSGNHSLEMVGQGVSVANADIRQRSEFQGLLISALCSSRKPGRETSS